MPSPAIVNCYEAEHNRGIVIGDIHGCCDQLKALLKKVNFTNEALKEHPYLLNQSNDEYPLCSTVANSNGCDDICVFVGDIVNKGPDSFGCVRLLRALGAIGVMGNHDAKIVSICNSIKQGNISPEQQQSSLYKLALKCPDDVLDYLSNLPHILHLPRWKVIVTHAGLDPTVSLYDQDAEAVTRMRRLQKKGDSGVLPEDYLAESQHFFAIEKGKQSTPWYKEWKEVVKNRIILCKEPAFVDHIIVYGHDAKTRLNVKKRTIGLDSGCVYGGSLTALLLPTLEIIDVPGYHL